MEHLDDEVGGIDWLEVLRAKFEDMPGRRPQRMRESAVVGVLSGAILFEETDDTEEVCRCCEEALRRLNGLSRGYCPLVDDDEAIRDYLMRTLMSVRDTISP